MNIYAERKLAGVTQQAPGETGRVWANWGVLALRQRNFDAAAQGTERAHELAPRDDHIYYLLGILESNRGRSVQAIGKLAQSGGPQSKRLAHRLCACPGNRAARRSRQRSRIPAGDSEDCREAAGQSRRIARS